MGEIIRTVEGFVNDPNNSVCTYAKRASRKIDDNMKIIAESGLWKPISFCRGCQRLLRTHNSQSLAMILKETNCATLLSEAWITDGYQQGCAVCSNWRIILVELWRLAFSGFKGTVEGLTQDTDCVVSLLQRAKLDFHYMLREIPFFLTSYDDEWYNEFKRIHTQALFGVP